MRAVQCTCDRRVRPVSAFPNAGRKVTVWTRESQHGRLFEELNERQNHRQIGVYNGGRKVSRRKPDAHLGATDGSQQPAMPTAKPFLKVFRNSIKRR